MLGCSHIKISILALVLLQVFIWRCNSVQIVQVISDSHDIANNDFNRGRKQIFEIGTRVEGDRLVEHFYNSTSHSKYGNYTLNFEYPSHGTGALFSYIKLTIYQDPDNFNYTILSGGINKRKIAILITSNQTKYVAYNAFFYGS